MSSLFGIEDRDHDGNPHNDNTDDDTAADFEDTDDDNDTIPTIDEDPDGNNDPTNDNSDGDGLPDYLDPDDDDDSVPTADEDPDGDGNPLTDDTDDDRLPNYRDPDDDGDGVLTIHEDPNRNNDPTDDDSDDDLVPDYLDTDSPGAFIFDDSFESPCPIYYLDEDDDNFGSVTDSVQTCDGQPPGHVTNDLDCYDSNADARPDQEQHFTTHRGDGSFDYNCDDEETISVTTKGACSLNEDVCDLTQGWESTPPNCGSTGTRIDACGAPVVIGTPPFLECSNYTKVAATGECH